MLNEMLGEMLGRLTAALVYNWEGIPIREDMYPGPSAS